MLVDLARNDLSRHCHNVTVEYYKDMQFYSHVIHLVSRVRGELDKGADRIMEFIDTFGRHAERCAEGEGLAAY